MWKMELTNQFFTADLMMVVNLGGTITHHHAVGRDHKAGYEQQTSDLYRQTLIATKQTLDPAGILNPGALIDPHKKAQ